MWISYLRIVVNDRYCIVSMSCVINENLIKMELFDLRSKTCFISDENRVVFHLVFHWVSRFIHLTQMEDIYWLLTA